MDPEVDENAWCAERRKDVARHLREQGVVHGRIGDAPAWFIAPHVSVWGIESLKQPGFTGWWVISGDLPTDYCSAAGDCSHPRVAIRHFAERWLSAIAQTGPGDTVIARTGLPASVLPQLKSRADLLLAISADDEAWTG